MGKDLVAVRAGAYHQARRELQAGEHDVGDGLTNNEVLAPEGRRIPDRYLRQAMLEEQTRIAPDVATGNGRLPGPRSIVRTVSSRRSMRGRARLERWMTERSCCNPNGILPNGRPGAQAGAFASIQRAFAGKRRYSLARAGRSRAGRPLRARIPVWCGSRRTSAGAHEAISGPPSSLYWVGALTAAAALIVRARARPAPAGRRLTARRGPSPALPGRERAHQVALEQILDRLRGGKSGPQPRRVARHPTFANIAKKCAKHRDSPPRAQNQELRNCGHPARRSARLRLDGQGSPSRPWSVWYDTIVRDV